MTLPALSIHQLKKTYLQRGQAKEALKGIDLVVPKGAIMALLGMNGAGKSTLINILAGLTIKTSGTVKIGEVDIDSHPTEARRYIGVVPQELFLDPFFTVRETLENYAGYYNIPKKARKTDELLQALGLEDKANVRPRALSGGMRRRLLIGKALVHSPPLLILDEPTAGVDIELRRQLWEYIRQLHQQGTTILLTTHYLEEAQALCDTTAIIHHGELLTYGPTETLLKNYGQKRAIFYPHEAVHSLPETLLSLSASLQEDGGIQFPYREDDLSLHLALQAFTQTGLTLRDMKSLSPNLTDVFLHLTHSPLKK